MSDKDQQILKDHHADVRSHMKKCLGSDRGITFPGPNRPFVRTGNDPIVGEIGAFDHLERAVNEHQVGPVPYATPNTGFLCGPIATAGGLNAMRRVQHRVMGLADHNNDITHDHIMAALFSDYNPSTANDPTLVHQTNVQGTPIPEYHQFLTRRLTQFGLTPGTQPWNEEWDLLTRLNNLNVTTLRLIPDFLFESEFYSRVLGDPNIRFNFGVVTAGNRSNGRDFPTRAYLLNSDANADILTI